MAYFITKHTIDKHTTEYKVQDTQERHFRHIRAYVKKSTNTSTASSCKYQLPEATVDMLLTARGLRHDHVYAQRRLC